MENLLEQYEGTFKAYDIRGLNSVIDEDYAKRLALNLMKKLDFSSVAIGFDMRTGSEALAKAVSSVFASKGISVKNFGLCSTPMLYFLTKEYSCDLGIVVTASHNPLNYLGFKICGSDLIPYSPKEIFKEDFEMFDLKKLNFPVYDVNSSYIEEINADSFINNYFSHNFTYDILKMKRFVVDFSNGATTTYEKSFFEHNFKNAILLNGTISKLSHGLDPLNLDNCKDAIKAVKKYNADFGIVYDGDGDRTVLIDETGSVVSGDDFLLLLLSSMTKDIVPHYYKALYDVRSTKDIENLASEKNITLYKSRVGHYFIKKMMHEKRIDIAGEKSSHFYFKKAGYVENSLVLFSYLNEFFTYEDLISRELSSLKQWLSSGEINYEVHLEKGKVISDLKFIFDDFSHEEIDGLSVYSDTFWFNIRFSNTEPLMRLNLEAVDKEILAKVRGSIEKYLNLE